MLIVITCPENELVMVSKATEVVGDNLSFGVRGKQNLFKSRLLLSIV